MENIVTVSAIKKERKNVVYVGFMDLEKAYDWVNREALWQVLRLNGVVNKLWAFGCEASKQNDV